VGKSLADTKAFVLSQLQQKLGSLTAERDRLTQDADTVEALANQCEREAKSKRASAEMGRSRAREISLEIEDFREELRRQQATSPR
jgi:hypothetical protein